MLLILFTNKSPAPISDLLLTLSANSFSASGDDCSFWTSAEAADVLVSDTPWARLAVSGSRSAISLIRLSHAVFQISRSILGIRYANNIIFHPSASSVSAICNPYHRSKEYKDVERYCALAQIGRRRDLLGQREIRHLSSVGLRHFWSNRFPRKSVHLPPKRTSLEHLLHPFAVRFHRRHHHPAPKLTAQLSLVEACRLHVDSVYFDLQGLPLPAGVPAASVAEFSPRVHNRSTRIDLPAHLAPAPHQSAQGHTQHHRRDCRVHRTDVHPSPAALSLHQWDVVRANASWNVCSTLHPLEWPDASAADVRGDFSHFPKRSNQPPTRRKYPDPNVYLTDRFVSSRVART